MRPCCISLLLLLVQMTGYSFTRKLRDSFCAYEKTTYFDIGSSGLTRIKTYFEKPLRASLRPGAKRKNLVLLLGESLEQQVLGEFNPRYPGMMPYLSELSRNSLFAPNWTMVPNTDWSIAGIFASQCGLPLMVPQFPYYQSNDRASVMFHNQSSFKCVGDYLQRLGYKGAYVYSGLGYFSGIQRLFVQHGLAKGFDKASAGIGLDWKLMDRVRMLLPSLVSDGTPFYLLIGYCDTHPPFKEEQCKYRRGNWTDHKGLRVFDCLDQRIEETVKLLESYGINRENTVLVVQGDHTLRDGAQKWSVGGRFDRKMFMLFPWERKRRVDKGVFHFDMPHTILDLLGVDYDPPFPYGKSILEPGESELPAKEEYDYLLSFFNIL